MSQLPRVLRLRDVVLFNITAIVGLRWLTESSKRGSANAERETAVGGRSLA